MKTVSKTQASLTAIVAVLACASTPASASNIADKAIVTTAATNVAANVDQPVASSDITEADNEATDPDRPIVPMGGNINPFKGNINPFKGNIDPFGRPIDPFKGNINPFFGDVGAVWDTLDPFSAQSNVAFGLTDPSAGKVDPLTGAVLPSYDEYNAFWNQFGDTWEQANYALDAIQQDGDSQQRSTDANRLLNELVGSSQSLWGDAVSARTGKSFEDGFLDPLFAKFGIGSDRKAGFLALSKSQRAHLITEWFDGLMDYTGNDHVDHWMAMTNWTPELTKVQGSGADSIIGILDSSITNDTDLQGKVFSAGGYNAGVGGHGTGVASLLVAGHDGRGVYGIAPNASVATYNPFDKSGTASWTDIRRGIISLKRSGASVINMSLGIKGWTLHSEWNTIFTNRTVKRLAEDTVFVIASGNDGSTQSQDILWEGNSDIALLVVGSVDPSGNVSDFSNRPGTACLTERLGSCTDNAAMGLGLLRNRFLVAPGELILMSDGHGGLTRSSGTSFAAPLVSGAVTLLHDRWPWLSKYARESADIILQSATDLGAQGVDDIYGHGLLNIEASQAPLDFDNLEFYEHKRGVVGYGEVGKGKSHKKKASEVLSAGIGATWEQDEVYLVAFEKIGDTQRDFLIPFSSRLIGQRTDVLGSNEYFQNYVGGRFKKWMKKRTGRNSNLTTGFTDIASIDNASDRGWSFGFSSSQPVSPIVGNFNGLVPQMPDHTAVRMASEGAKFSLTTGVGQGSMMLTGNSGFGLTSDYRFADGGINPVLGLASGGGFMDAEFQIAANTTLAFGVSEGRLEHGENTDLTRDERDQLRSQRDYTASAMNMRLSHSPITGLDLSVSLASVNERDGLLGVQSALASDLTHGSNSRTVTLGANAALPFGFDLAMSATGGETRSRNGADQNLRTDGAVSSSAYAVSLGKQGVLGANDHMRISFSQPLHIENGTLEYSSVEVVDRATGEIGVNERNFAIGGGHRRHTAELLYAAPLGQTGELSLFGRADMNAATGADQNENGPVNEFIAGGMISLSF